MNTATRKKLISVLQREIVQTDEMFQAGKSPAYIVGYLQGVIKQTIALLEVPANL